MLPQLRNSNILPEVSHHTYICCTDAQTKGVTYTRYRESNSVRPKSGNCQSCRPPFRPIKPEKFYDAKTSPRKSTANEKRERRKMRRGEVREGESKSHSHPPPLPFHPRGRRTPPPHSQPTPRRVSPLLLLLQPLMAVMEVGQLAATRRQQGRGRSSAAAVARFAATLSGRHGRQD